MKIKAIQFFSNGNTMAIDENGNQIGYLQESWFLLYINYMYKTYGFDKENPNMTSSPEEIEFILPNGQKAQYIEKFNNWKII